MEFSALRAEHDSRHSSTSQLRLVPQTEASDSEETDAALKEAADSGGLSELLRVVERSELLSERNVVTCFAALAKLAVGKNMGQLDHIHEKAPFLNLVGESLCTGVESG